MEKNEQDTDETLKVEKIIKKLETFDIREWTMYRNGMSVKANGIEFCLKKEISGTFHNYHDSYSLSIKNIEDDVGLIEYQYPCNDKNTTLGKMIGDFYKKIQIQLRVYKTQMLEEKLDEFLKE